MSLVLLVLGQNSFAGRLIAPTVPTLRLDASFLC